MNRSLFALCALFAVSACAQGEAPRPEAEYGPDPQLAQPNAGGAPVINYSRAVGWPAEGAPTAPEGFSVTRYAEDLDHPRWLYLLPNGDVLVAEATSKQAKSGGVVGWVRNLVMQRAGALEGVGNRIVLLRDADRDGEVDTQGVFIDGLAQPFGMALVGSRLFVANTNALVAFDYAEGATQIDGAGEKLLDLPYYEDDNGHWTRDLEVSADGTKLYISVGSLTNIGEAGMALEENRAAIWEYDIASGAKRLFATGLRNPVGMDTEPQSSALWVVVNERDMLGDALVPDYMTSVQEGAFYGWPYSYYGQHVDARVKPQSAELVAGAIAPDYALGAHTASLGLHFYRGEALGAHYRGGAFVGQHGSWNRRVRVGYKVVFVPFADGKPSGAVEDFLTGFLNADGHAKGRPVGVIEDATGALLVADDVGDRVWRVAPN